MTSEHEMRNTTKDEALRLALEALFAASPDNPDQWQAAITACREALAQPSEWVGLNDEERKQAIASTAYNFNRMDVARAIEAKLREKNAKPAEKNPTCDECDGTGKVHGSQTTLACPECTPDDAPWPLKRIADLERQVEHLKERNRKQFKTIAAVSREPLTRADIEDALRAKLAAELQDLMYSHKAETGECDEINCDFLAAWQDAMDIILGVSEHGRT